MNKVGYIIKSDNYKAEFSKGFFNRSLNMLASTISGVVPPWKASSLYNEQLDMIAVMIAVGRYNERDDDKINDIWTKILELCEKNDVTSLVVEDVKLPLKPIPYQIFTGTDALFFYFYSKHMEEGAIARDSDVGIFIPDEFGEPYLKFFSDELNYIKFFNNDVRYATAAAEYVYRHNGTAAEATNAIGSMSKCEVIFVLDQKQSQTSRHFKAKIVIDPFRQEVRSLPNLKMKVYTDKLGELMLSPAFLEAIYYNRYGLLPKSNIPRFIGEVKNQFKAVQL
jgi:hypothetical protein